METTTIIIIAVVLILLVIAGIMMTRPKTEAEVDADLTKEVSKAETKLEEKTAELQDANKKLAAEPTPKKAAEVVKKSEEVKEAAAKVEEKKTEKAVVQAQKINCKVGDWGEYSQCELVDGVWKKKKTRSILTPASNGGMACPSDLEMREVCQKVNCEMNSWSDFTECKKDSDGVWRKSRRRTVKSEPMYGGESCGALTENQDCVISNSVKGRYVSVGFLDVTKIINVLQLDVFDIYNNLISAGKVVSALGFSASVGKPVTGLNILPQFPGANLVNDVRYSGADGQLTHTAGTSPNEFVEIDLGQEYEISRIVLYNRTSCCADRIVGGHITISTKPNRENIVYKSDKLTANLFQWVYPPSTKVIVDQDAGYDNRPRGFYNIDNDPTKSLVRCRYVGDGANIRMSCATADTMYLDVYKGKKIEDILGDSVKTPSNFIRMFREDVPMSNF
jgi:hypothetical protein